MDPQTLWRVRRFLSVAADTMRSVPLPVPSDVEDWDGAEVDTTAFYRAYNRLPTQVQKSID